MGEKKRKKPLEINEFLRKKVLSLVLCVAVMLSVMVLGAGAAFSDQDQIENTEAVDACSALNIIGGYEDGSFHPERNIKRSEITKMICVALNGGKDPNVGTNEVPTFTDVRGTADAWAEGYIEACVAQGIVSGVGGGRFSPAGNVTGAQLAKMLLVALGYNSDNEGFIGNAWETNVNVRAAQKHLYDGLEKMDTSAAVTRDQAAQMVWNAMQAYEVEYKTNIITDENGNLVTQVVVQDKVVGSNNDKITLLRDKYSAWVNVGTLTVVDGSNLTISMNAADKAASDLVYENSDNVVFTKVSTDYSALMGQKVKVMFKNGNTNEVIGVYATGDNTVVTAYKNEIGTESGKIVIGNTSYSLDTKGVKTIVDGVVQSSNWNAVDFKSSTSPDVVTLIDSDSDSKLDTAVIKTVDVQKVTFASTTQIIAGGKTYKFSDENIATGVAKDDFVVITKNLYNDNLDITIASKATGTVDATKGSSSAYSDYQIDGTWYAAAADRDEINASVKAGTKVEYVVVNNILFYAVKTSSTSSTLEDVLFVAYVGQDGLSNDQARVMFPNGSKSTVTLKKTVDENGAAIAAGKFYEFTKSGDQYELTNVKEYPGAANTEQYKDYYGDYTYFGTENLNGQAASNGPTDVLGNVGKIDDNADVIIYQPQNASGAYESTPSDVVKAEIKHITGKQLKSNGSVLNSSTLVTATLGAFQSKVDGFERATVLAVTYTGAWSNIDSLASNSNYGFLVADAEKVADGIRLQMITADQDSVITVYADKSNVTDFDKGAVVGYSSITEGTDGKQIVNDPTVIKAYDSSSNPNGIKAASISATNGTDKISTASDSEMDLDDFTTVIYTSSYNNTIEKVKDGKPAKAEDGRTNILYIKDTVAIIDANEIVGQVYATKTVDYTAILDSNSNIDSSKISSLQWTNASTGQTYNGKALTKVYDNSVWNLSITTKTAGKLEVTVGGSPVISKELSAGQNYNETTLGSIKTTGNIVITFGASSSSTGATLTDPDVFDIGSAFANNTTVTVKGKVPTSFDVPNGKTLVLETATLQDATTITGNGTVQVKSLDAAGKNITAADATIDLTGATIYNDSALTGLSSVKDDTATVEAARVTKLLGYTTAGTVTVKNVSGALTVSATGKTLNMGDAASTVSVTNGTVSAGNVTGDVTVSGGALTAKALSGKLTLSNSVTVTVDSVAGEITDAAGTTLTINNGVLSAATAFASSTINGTVTLKAEQKGSVLEAIIPASGAKLTLTVASDNTATVSNVGAGLKFWATAGSSGSMDGTSAVTTGVIAADTYVYAANAYYGGSGSSSESTVWVAE